VQKTNNNNDLTLSSKNERRAPKHLPNKQLVTVGSWKLAWG